MSDGEILERHVDNVRFHIDEYWVPAIPLDERNKAAVAAIVTKVLIDHTRWLVARTKGLEEDLDRFVERSMDLAKELAEVRRRSTPS
jgi:hypothetical protein